MAEELSTNPTKQTKFDETMPTAVGGNVRIINFLIDVFLLAMLASVILNNYFPNDVPKDPFKPQSGVFMMVLYPLQFGYFFFSEYFFGRTFGKVITRTFVVTEYNEKPSFTAILIRTLCRYIPLEFLTFIGNGIGWHDKFSKTYVVRKPGL